MAGYTPQGSAYAMDEGGDFFKRGKGNGKKEG